MTTKEIQLGFTNRKLLIYFENSAHEYGFDNISNFVQYIIMVYKYTLKPMIDDLRRSDDGSIHLIFHKNFHPSLQNELLTGRDKLKHNCFISIAQKYPQSFPCLQMTKAEFVRLTTGRRSTNHRQGTEGITIETITLSEDIYHIYKSLNVQLSIIVNTFIKILNDPQIILIIDSKTKKQWQVRLPKDFE